MDTRIRKRTAYTIGEFEVEGTPLDFLTPVVKVSDDGLKALVAYAEHDSYARNPLEDCDGMGAIHHHPNSRYGGRDSDYCEVLGLDRYGNPDLENDAVVARVEAKLRAAVEAADLSDIVKVLADAEDEDIHYDASQVRELLLGDLRDIESWSDISDAARSMCWELWSTSMWPDELRDAIDATLPSELDWEAEFMAALEAGEIGDRDAVLLDRYEHGLCRYSVSSGRRDWDLSSGDAVWVPDKYAREEIERRAAVYAFGRIEETGYKSTRKYVATFDPAFRKDSEEFEDWGKAFAWLQLVSTAEGWQATPEQLRAGRYAAADELAEQACEQYTDWANGECYGVIVELHTRTSEDGDWEFVEQLDSCFGYIGGDYAEERLAEAIEEQTALLGNATTED